MCIIEFEAILKTNEQIRIAGFVEYDEIDDDECVQYYDHNGFENGYNIPNNPYPENTLGSYNNHIDYEILKNNFCADSLFLQFLADYHDESFKSVNRGNYILKIWGGE